MDLVATALVIAEKINIPALEIVDMQPIDVIVVKATVLVNLERTNGIVGKIVAQDSHLHATSIQHNIKHKVHVQLLVVLGVEVLIRAKLEVGLLAMVVHSQDLLHATSIQHRTNPKALVKQSVVCGRLF